MRIMLIDDSPTMRAIQRTVLNRLGYTEVEDARDGQEALTKAAAFSPQLLLVDLAMPVMDGLAFVKSYRQAGRTAPIILVTTEAEQGRVIEAFKAGVNGHILKPFTPDLLAARIRDTIARCGVSSR